MVVGNQRDTTFLCGHVCDGLQPPMLVSVRQATVNNLTFHASLQGPWPKEVYVGGNQAIPVGQEQTLGLGD